MSKIDLHIHTHFSDGGSSPEDVVKLAKQRKLKAIAITDHDVVSGVSRALKAGKHYKIEVIPGIEFSAKVDCSNDSIHLLGLFINPKNVHIQKFSKDIEKRKLEKTKKQLDMINKLLKTKLKIGQVKSKTDGVIAFPHIAMVLYDQGYIKSVREGIYNFFIKGKPCYVLDDKLIHAKDAIKMIHSAGGVAILAHLFAYKKVNKFTTKKIQKKLVEELILYGLDGLEVYYPQVTDKEYTFIKSLCKKYNLLASAGSDFHDETILKQNKLGSIKSDYSLVKAMKERIKSRNIKLF